MKINMLFNRLTHSQKTLLLVGAVVIAGVLLYIGIAEPVWNNWQKLNKNIFAMERKLVKNKKILAQKDRIVKLYDKYAENIRMKGSDKEEIAVILRAIENIARASNVNITEIKPNKVNDMEFYKEFFVELDAEGTMSNLAKFIYDLQNSKQILKVRYLHLNAKPGKEETLKGHLIVTKVLIP